MLNLHVAKGINLCIKDYFWTLNLFKNNYGIQSQHNKQKKKHLISLYGTNWGLGYEKSQRLTKEVKLRTFIHFVSFHATEE